MPLTPAAPRSCLPPADALRMGLQRCSAGDALPPIFTGPRVSLLSFLKDIFRRGQGSRLAVSRFQRVEGAFRGLLAVAVPGQDAADGGSLLLSGQFVFCLRLLTTFRVSAVSVYVEARASCRLSCLVCARRVRRFAAGALV